MKTLYEMADIWVKELQVTPIRKFGKSYFLFACYDCLTRTHIKSVISVNAIINKPKKEYKRFQDKTRRIFKQRRKMILT